MDPVLMTPRELAELLKLGRNKTYELLASGELPIIRFGRAIRVPRSAVLNWIDRAASAAKGVSRPPEKQATTGWRVAES